MTEKRVFTLAAGLPFLDRLAETLLDDPTLGGTFEGGSSLGETRIFLPTRRAVRGLIEAFLRRVGDSALILPEIQPLGDLDVDELTLASEGGPAFADLDAIPPALSPLKRQAILARLILARDRAEGGPGAAGRAFALARELGALLDTLTTEGVDPAQLAGLVPERFAEQWQVNLDFLQIVTESWPAILAEEGAVDAADARDRRLRLLAESWRASPPEGPVLVAGSTGSIPAAAELIGTVAALPQGAVLLPGLDLDLDETSWRLAPASHPQYGLKKLLVAIGIEREAVRLWPGTQREPARGALVRETLRPAETADAWQKRLGGLGPERDAAFRGLGVLEAPNEGAESLAVALLMREALETPGRTAQFVTPDRNLARRVAAELGRFGLEVDDSAGEPLSLSPPGTFLRLTVEAAAAGLAPVPLLACLKHPLCRLGLAPGEIRSAVRRLERWLLRGPRPEAGIEGLKKRLATLLADRHAEGRPAPPAQERAVAELLATIGDAFAPLIETLSLPETSLDTLLRAHLTTAEALSAEASSGALLWGGDAGEAAARLLSEAFEAADPLAAIDPKGYPHLFDELLAGAVVRPRGRRHPRLAILGPLEARLLSADRLILGGLNEGTWPAIATVDPWLNRPMRADLGLEPPERRIGQAAHDLEQALNAPEVILTRSQKSDGQPTVPSRWVMRLDTVARGLGFEGAPRLTEPLRWSEALDRPEAVQAASAPRPAPPLEARPVRLSVTDVERLIRDPYAIYARHVLGLRPLDPLDEAADARERGTLIHKAMEIFAREMPEALPADAEQRLHDIAETLFARDPHTNPAIAAFWWPRFQRAIPELIRLERERRTQIARVLPEISGEYTIAGLARPVALRGKADRIDLRADGRVDILDFKTGQVPTADQVESGLNPQLSLEAAMVRAGAFSDAGAREAAHLYYIAIGYGTPPASLREAGKTKSADELATESLAELTRLLRAYEDPDKPYLSRPRVQFVKAEGDYDHLARVKEWTADAAEEGE